MRREGSHDALCEPSRRIVFYDKKDNYKSGRILHKYFKIIFTTTVTTYILNTLLYNLLLDGCSNFKI